MPKRQRGGQPNNKNAEKHGFYSAALSPYLQNVFRRALDLRDAGALQQETAICRTQVYRLLQDDPTNHDILVRLVNTIARVLASNHRLSANQESEMGAALRETLADLLPDRELDL